MLSIWWNYKKITHFEVLATTLLTIQRYIHQLTKLINTIQEND